MDDYKKFESFYFFFHLYTLFYTHAVKLLNGWKQCSVWKLRMVLHFVFYSLHILFKAFIY